MFGSQKVPDWPAGIDSAAWSVAGHPFRLPLLEEAHRLPGEKYD